MKTSTILLSVALAFKTIYTKAIDNGVNIKSSQLAVIKNDINLEIINGKNFTYKYHCNDDKDERKYCEGIKNDLDYAFTKLSDTFEFYQPIVFETYVEDFAKYHEDNTLAFVTDSNYVSLKSSNDSVPYIYPQALAKQLVLNKEPDYKKNDFKLVINSCDHCRDNEFRSIYIHEILHGLGFSNRNLIVKLDDSISENSESELELTEDSQYAIFPYRVPLYDEKLMENVSNIEEYNNQIMNTEISKFPPLNIFDKYIASLESGEKLYDDLSLYYEELNQKCLPKDGSPLHVKDTANKYSKECFEKLSSETQEKITRIVTDYFFMSNSTGFLTMDGDIISLQTYDYHYMQGSSISHITNPLNDMFMNALLYDPDFSIEDWIDLQDGVFKKEKILEIYDDKFIIYASDDDNFTVEEMIELLPNNKKHPLIGDGIVKIFKTMGWTEKGEQRSNEMYYVDESINIPEDNSFEYEEIKKSEILSKQAEEPTSTIDDIEIETLLPTDVNETDIEVEDITDSIDQESNSDSDTEEE